jgi:hypothetical protein
MFNMYETMRYFVEETILVDRMLIAYSLFLRDFGVTVMNGTIRAL